MAVLVAIASVSTARAEVPLVIDRETWDAGDESICLAENDSPSPAIVHAREARLPQDPILHLDAAVGVFMGIGSPGGVGGAAGEIKSSHTPVSVGYAALVAADVRVLRPIWLHVQAHGFESPRFGAGAAMGDLMIGYDVWRHYGNQFVKARIRRSYPARYAYDCILNRADVAFVAGTKQVYAHGDPRLTIFTALSTGMQLRFSRYLWGTTFGMDVNLLGLYDPELRTGGAQFQEVVHVGSFLIVASAGGLYRRGGWAMFGAGTTFGM